MKKRFVTKRRRRYLDPATLLLLRQIGYGALACSLVTLTVLGIWHGTRLPRMMISEVEVRPGLSVPTEMVLEAANTALDGTYAELIPRRFFLFYPEANVLSAVKNLERIREVEVDLVDKNKLSISFSEYLPEALWCATDTKNECVFLDEAGYAFAPAPDLTGGAYLRFYVLGAEPEIKRNPFANDDYYRLLDLVGAFEKNGWFVSGVEIDSVRDVFLTFAGGGEFKATLKETNDKTFGYWKTLVESAVFSHLKPGNFKYIDVRFGPKLFVNEEEDIEVDLMTESATSTTATGTAALN